MSQPRSASASIGWFGAANRLQGDSLAGVKGHRVVCCQTDLGGALEGLLKAGSEPLMGCVDYENIP